MKDDLQLSQVTTAVKRGVDPTERVLDLDAMTWEDDSLNSMIEGIYAHIPFCRHRCHYCDFYTLAGREDDRSAFVTRLIDEIDHAPRGLMMDSLTSVFVGGGTPTLLPLDDLTRLLSRLNDRFVSEKTEFSVEANPRR